METSKLFCLVACFAVTFGFTVKVKRGVSPTDKTTILNKHNELRRKVQTDTGKVAIDMQKAYWDDDLAAKAQAWVDTCPTSHDSNAAREPLDSNGAPKLGHQVGQNYAAGHTSWEEVIQAWYDEIEFFTYGIGADEEKRKLNKKFVIGHFTQVVQGGVSRIGCGYKKGCGTYDTVYICNYITANWNDKMPYKTGESAAASCPSHKSGNLCDFKGKLCKHGGELNLNDGTCKCVKNFGGDECQTVTCPKDGDPPHPCSDGCESNYQNVKQLCPYMCKYCTSDCKKTASDCKNGGSVDMEACACKCKKGFSGSTCTTCPKTEADYGDWCSKNCNWPSTAQNYCPVTCKSLLTCTN